MVVKHREGTSSPGKEGGWTIIALAAAYFALFVVGSFLLIKVGMTSAYDLHTVQTRVNITQALPIIDRVTINSGSPINLTPGGIRYVVCNASIRDYNGIGDFTQVNATFFRANGSAASQYGALGSQDNNSRYFSDNCTYNATTAPFTYAWTCVVNMTYYAFNGTWNCTVWANNTLNSPTNGTNSSWVYPLFAINVTDVVNYGNLAVFDTSGVQSVNVTNWGNLPLNLTVYGYGGSANATGGGKSFDCPSGTNISIDNERYAINDSSVAWGSMTVLTSGPRLISGMTIPKQSSDVEQWNTTYWKLYIPPNPFGLCNGTIVYEAIQGGIN